MKQTSLELAVENDANPQIIKILLENGAKSVSSKPLHDSAVLLAAKTSSKALPMLLNYVRDPEDKKLVNAKNFDGKQNWNNFYIFSTGQALILKNTIFSGLAAIHYCSQYGNLKGVEELIKFGADVNIQDDTSGRTALFYAVETKCETMDLPQETFDQIAHKLLEAGANSSIQTFSKHCVLNIVEEIKSNALKIAIGRAAK